MARGRVQFFNAAKGYGFIGRADGGRDCFVHARELRRTGIDVLNAGDTVEFDIASDERGRPYATGLRVLAERVGGQ